MEEKRKGILRSLETDLVAVNEQASVFEVRFSAATKVLDQLKSGMLWGTILVRTCTRTCSCCHSLRELVQTKRLKQHNHTPILMVAEFPYRTMTV